MAQKQKDSSAVWEKEMQMHTERLWIFEVLVWGVDRVFFLNLNAGALPDHTRIRIPEFT